MWARVIEMMIAFWLAISPFVFRYEGDQTALWVNDYVTSSLILLFASVSFYPPLERMHFLIIPVCFWLIGFGFLGADPPPPAPYQNYVLTGFLLGMFAVLPSRNITPPKRWQEFYGEDLME